MTTPKLSLLISATYVGLATIYALSNPGSVGFFYIFFLPANFFAHLIIFTEREPFAWLLVSQLITLGIIYFLIWPFVFLSRQKSEK